MSGRMSEMLIHEAGVKLHEEAFEMNGAMEVYDNVTFISSNDEMLRPNTLDVRRELVISDTHLNTLDTGLQELASLKASPDLYHREVAGSQY